MRKWKKLLPFVLLLCLLTASSGAEGILPVLQTPMPEILRAVSMHAMRNEDAPAPKTGADGTYTYEYAKVTYDQYLTFGQILGQDGFALESSETAENGAVTAVVVKDDWARLTVTYNPADLTLKVAYPPRVEAMETDPDNPCRVEKDSAGILPEVPHAISLQSISGWNLDKTGKAEDGGIRCRYSAVSYDGYTLLSQALGREGYSLVSAETLEDGTSRAVVTDGAVSLTVDYNLDSQTAWISYPVGVYPREAVLFDDFTGMELDQPVQVTEGVKMTFLGWEITDNWYSYWVNNNWIPAKTGYNQHPAEEGTLHVWLEFRVEYNRRDEMKLLSLMPNRAAYYEDTGIKSSAGGRDAAFKLDSVSSWKMSGEKTSIIAVVITLQDSQAARMEDVRYTFSSADYLHRYAVRLTEANRKPAAEAE